MYVPRGGRTQTQIVYMAGVSLYGMFSIYMACFRFIWHVFSLYGMFSVYTACFPFIWHVSVYMACVSLYGMCQFIWHVSVYMECVSLYGMFSVYIAFFQFI